MPASRGGSFAQRGKNYHDYAPGSSFIGVREIALLVVEGEVGYIGQSSKIVESVPAGSLTLTTSEEAAQFAVETKVDVLAPAVGNMHGLLPLMVRGETHKRMDIERIRQIKQATGAFLTLHGGSGTADANEVTPYKILPGAEQAMEDVIARRLTFFSSNGRS